MLTKNMLDELAKELSKQSLPEPCPCGGPENIIEGLTCSVCGSIGTEQLNPQPTPKE